MDINQSPLSGYQSNKSKGSGSISEARAITETSRVKNAASTSSSSSKPLELKEGQTVQGQVIDHRYNEVKVQLEPGKQVITAKLSGDVPLSIGQEAQFQVTEEASGHLVLKYIPNENSAPNEAAIQKALSASNLPMTENNKALVSELFNHRMPIDKQTLQNLVRLSIKNREASPLTLVLMYKNNIPMTPANIKQFEAYQNGTHQLLNDIKTISQNISDILKQTDSSLLQTASDELPNSPLAGAIRMNGSLIDILYKNSDVYSTTTFDTLINNTLNQEELNLLNRAVEQKIVGNPTLSTGIPFDIFQKLKNGTLTLNEAVKLITKLYFENSEQQIPQEISQGIPQASWQASQMTPQALQETIKQILAKVQNNPEASVLSNLLGQYTQLQDTSAKLSEVLSLSEREALLNNLSVVPDGKDMQSRITQGIASMKETLTYLQEILSQTNKQTVSKLLQAPEYSKLLEEAFLQKWTITPEKAANKMLVSDLYQHLKEDLESLSTVIKSGKESEATLRLQEPVRNMQDNLQFMKDLNDVFTYLQLPVQFKEQLTHSDLYVMTRKKALKDYRESLSVLLHLDMTNLGAINVHIQMNNGNRIQADFYLENSEAGTLIKDNLSTLTDALQKKGYCLQAEVKDNYKKTDFSQDFIEQSSQNNYVHRYTFDIRT